MSGDDGTVGMMSGWIQGCSAAVGVVDEVMMMCGLLNERLTS